MVEFTAKEWNLQMLWVALEGEFCNDTPACWGLASRSLHCGTYDVLENLLAMATYALVDAQCPKYAEGVRGDANIHIYALAEISSVFP